MDSIQSHLGDFLLFWALPAGVVLFVVFLVVYYFRSGEPFESFIVMYFGRRGQGKTVAMTMDILDWLSEGHIVYTNIKDITPNPKYHAAAKKNISNLHEVDFHTKQEFIDFISQARDCIVVLDEAIIFFDSKNTKNAGQDERVRHAIFTSRHRGVSIAYGVQRPMTALKDLRDVTDLFYQCTKTWVRHFKYIFTRTAFDLNSKGDDINMDEPIGTKRYTGRKVFGSFKKYGARDMKLLQDED
jgi:hypothetical protein